jgi:hypothetical protein
MNSLFKKQFLIGTSIAGMWPSVDDIFSSRSETELQVENTFSVLFTKKALMAEVSHIKAASFVFGTEGNRRFHSRFERDKHSRE